MRKYLYLLVNLLLSCATVAQNITITDPNSDPNNPIICANFQNGGTVNFFDDGGAGGNYSPGANETLTICPDLPNGPKLTVAVGTNAGFSWDVHGSDTLYVYDGPNTSAPLLGAHNSVTDPNGFNHSSSFENNPTGCLTFVFVSNGANEGTGWGANITCSNPPQPIGPHIEAFVNGQGPNALNPLDTGYVDICFGDSVLLVANPDLLYSFENNGFGYSQNLNNLDYEWEFSDGTVGPNNDSIWFTPSSQNGFFVNLFITDIFPQTVNMSCRIRVSQTPIFAGTGPIEDTVCFNTDAIISGGASSVDTVGVEFPGGSFEVGGSFAGLLPLPDGSGVNYSTDINMSGFNAGATFSSASDLQEICVTMEHSYLGDLEMWIECPNGSIATLFNANGAGFLPGGFGGGGTYLGEPIDNNTGNPGNGYEYCFSSVNNTWGDFPTEFAGGNTILLTSPPAPSAGNTMNPNGVYEPEDNFNNLIGCPLNGTWTLNIRDNLSIDDGFIFEWGLYFDAQLFPNSETYQNSISDTYWSPDPSIVSGLNGDTSITVNPPTPGNHEYTFNVEDNFGCLYDTTVTIHVLDTVINANSLDTTLFCADEDIPLWTNASGLAPFTYTWEDGQMGDTALYDVSSNGTYAYPVTITDDCGFQTSDTAFITLNQTLLIDSLAQIMADCGENNGAVLSYSSGYTGTPQFLWTGPGPNGGGSIDASVFGNLSPGWYYFSVEDDVCQVQDSILLEQAPPPNASFEAIPPFGEVPLDVVFVNTSDPADTYNWDFGNGQGASVNDLSNQTTTYTDENIYVVTLTITEGNCSDEATQLVNAIIILPLIYDLPNVFTPNGDGTNDFFRINAENVETFEIVILNRWGNVVFESNDANFEWNGQVQNTGAECTDGTYFYKFDITGEGNQQANEHGMIQLVRDTEDK